jgi:RHS repeat-associated protein
MTISSFCAHEHAPSERLFTGKERDTESGNDYFGARYYSSNDARFMSPDWSAKVEPVPYAKIADPQTLNLYSYVGNNPLSWTDRDGHYGCKGTKQQCQTFKNALAAVQKADAGLKKGTFERKRLDGGWL